MSDHTNKRRTKEIIEMMNQSSEGDSSPTPCSSWRILETHELPEIGDEAFLNGNWERVNIPSMWLAGGGRTDGDKFRRRIKKNNQDGVR